MSTDARTIDLDDRQKAQIAAVSDAAGKPWRVVLDEALARYRRDVAANGHAEESVLEAATRLGLVGCVRSGIPDLSTNPAHMEGFGTNDR